MGYKPEKLLEISRSASNLKTTLNHLCDEYVYAVATGRIQDWRKAVIAYIDFVTLVDGKEQPNQPTHQREHGQEGE
jgi:hypothetical protein